MGLRAERWFVKSARKTKHMFRISHQQIDKYQHQLYRRLSVKILVFLREECLKELDRIPDTIVLRMIDGGISKAQSYLLVSEYSIGLFISLLIKIGFAFDKQPAIQEILRRDDLNDNQRIDLIIETTTEQQWQQAQSLTE